MHCRDIDDDEQKQREERDQPDRADTYSKREYKETRLAQVD